MKRSDKKNTPGSQDDARFDPQTKRRFKGAGAKVWNQFVHINERKNGLVTTFSGALGLA